MVVRLHALRVIDPDAIESVSPTFRLVSDPPSLRSMTVDFPCDVVLRPAAANLKPSRANYDIDLRITYPIAWYEGRLYKVLVSGASLGDADAGDLVFRNLAREDFNRLCERLDFREQPNSGKVGP
jgi:hypothetical protein